MFRKRVTLTTKHQDSEPVVYQNKKPARTIKQQNPEKNNFRQGQAIKILVRLNNVKDVKRCMNILLSLPERYPFCYEQDSKYFTYQIRPLQLNLPKVYIRSMYASRFSKFAVILYVLPFTSVSPPINLIHSKIKIVPLKLLAS